MNCNVIKIVILVLLTTCTALLAAQVDNTNIWDVKAEDRICFALYTVHDNTLKLTAQLYPVRDYEPFRATLEIEKEGDWVKVAETKIIYPGYTAPFRIEQWNDTQEVKYRVVHNNKSFYEGIIRKNPIDQEEFVMATFSCNSVQTRHGGDYSREDIVDNMKRLQPDLLFFAGDQVYHHSEHLIYWLKFGRDFGDIIRNTPTICITDDHDIGQGNLWGDGGKAAHERRGHLGGYYMPKEYIMEVERAQTSHLPDPYDPRPVAQGIGVYYTDLKWGGIGFAILEDRKFKSGVGEVAAQNPDIFTEGPHEALFDPNVDARKLDVSGVQLLGERQLDFLEEWTTDWSNTEMKTVLSQTIFAQANNYTGNKDRPIIQDFDTNGWPQSGRNKALSIIRKSFSPMVAGDQHLASVVQHGVESWGDAGFSFATPAIANYWLRWWNPKEPGKNKEADAPYYTGDFYDGFLNKMTVKAIANPPASETSDGSKLTTRAAGYGIVKYNKSTRNITFECWGRNIDISNTNSKQYPGWPITISQMDNFDIKHGFELPTLHITKSNQVVTIRHTLTNKVVSSIRINGRSYQPKVLKEGKYTVEVGEGKAKIKIYEMAASERNIEIVNVKF